MILNVNSSKTYDNWLADNTDFFSNLENDYDVTVDPGTQDLIELFFGNRFICDDDNFNRFYKRALLNTWDRYIIIILKIREKVCIISEPVIISFRTVYI